jgi:hypothetical protein
VSIEFYWQVESEEWQTPSPPKRWRRFPWRVLGALALLLAVVAGIAAGRFWYRVRQGEERLRRELRTAANLEVEALQQGDWDLFLSLQDRYDTTWYNQQRRRVEWLSYQFGFADLEPGQQADLAILNAALIPSDSRAWAEVAWAMEDGIYSRVQFYRQEDGRWLRTGTQREYFGGTRIRETAHFAFKYSARDEPTVDWMATQLEAWYRAACADLVCDSGWHFDALVTSDNTTGTGYRSPRGFAVNSPRLRGVREDGAPLPEERAELAQILLYLLLTRQAGDVKAEKQPYLLPQLVNWEMQRLGLAGKDTPATPVLDYVMTARGIEGVRALLRAMGRSASEDEALRLVADVGVAEQDEVFGQYLAAILAVERQMMEFQTAGLVGPVSESLARQIFDALLAPGGGSWHSERRSTFQSWSDYPGIIYDSAMLLRQPSVDRWGWLDDSTVWAEVTYSETGWYSYSTIAPRQVEFFRQVDGAWRHAPPDERFLGEKVVLQSEHFSIEGHEREKDMMASELVFLESLYRQIASALQTGFAPGERLVVKILPSATSFTTSFRLNAQAVQVSVPSPYFWGTWGYGLDTSYLAGWVSTLLFEKLATRTIGLPEDSPVLSANYGIWWYIALNAWQSQIVGPGFQYEWDNGLRNAYPLSAAIRSGKLLTLTDLGHLGFSFYAPPDWSQDKWNLAYQEAAVFTGYLAEIYGPQAFPELLRSLPEADSMDSWLWLALDVDLATFEADWRAWLREKAAQ